MTSQFETLLKALEEGGRDSWNEVVAKMNAQTTDDILETLMKESPYDNPNTSLIEKLTEVIEPRAGDAGLDQFIRGMEFLVRQRVISTGIRTALHTAETGREHRKIL